MSSASELEIDSGGDKVSKTVSNTELKELEELRLMNGFGDSCDPCHENIIDNSRNSESGKQITEMDKDFYMKESKELENLKGNTGSIKEQGSSSIDEKQGSGDGESNQEPADVMEGERSSDVTEGQGSVVQTEAMEVDGDGDSGKGIQMNSDPLICNDVPKSETETDLNTDLPSSDSAKGEPGGSSSDKNSNSDDVYCVMDQKEDDPDKVESEGTTYVKIDSSEETKDESNQEMGDKGDKKEDEVDGNDKGDKVDGKTDKDKFDVEIITVNPNLGKPVADTVKDIDGSDILITINEDVSDGEKEKEAEKSDPKSTGQQLPVSQQQQGPVSKNNSVVAAVANGSASVSSLPGKQSQPQTSDTGNFPRGGVSVIDLSNIQEPSSIPPSNNNSISHMIKQRPAILKNPQVRPPYQGVKSNNIQLVMPPGMMQPPAVLPPISLANDTILEIAGMKYQKLTLNGKPMLVPLNLTNSNQSSNTLASQALSFAATLQGKTVHLPVISHVQTTPSVHSTQQASKTHTVTVSKVLPSQQTKPKSVFDKSDPDPYLPIASWEMIDICRVEAEARKTDNNFWTGLCTPNRKAEISSLTRFLLDLGSDIVKQSTYSQITRLQEKKKEAGKLSEQESENLVKMKKVVGELDSKLDHLKLDYKECEGCGFKTESTNVMHFHKEHPHMLPKFDPYGIMQCAHCSFETKEATEYSFHMEAEHSMIGRVYSKPVFWQCSLCYFEHNTKNKLTQHKFRCMKHFKSNINQAPYHPDVNYCLKNTFFQYQIPKPQVTMTVPPANKVQPPSKSILQQGLVVRPAKPSLVPIQITSGTNLTVPTSIFATQKAPLRPGVGQLPGVVYSNKAATLVPRAMNIPNVRQHLAQRTQPMVVPEHPAPANVTTTNNNNNKGTFEVCEICGGYVKDRQSLRVHFFYAHKIDMPITLFNRSMPPLLCEYCKTRFWTSQGFVKHVQATGHKTLNKPLPGTGAGTLPQKQTVCWVCKLAVANLHAHLNSIHHLSYAKCLEVKRCFYCGVCMPDASQKFIEDHITLAHGIVFQQDSKPQKITTTTVTKDSSVKSNVCVFCKVRFDDNTKLTMHCLNVHATCSKCGMVVASQEQLRNHMCRQSGVRACSICGAKNIKAQYYLFHLRTHTKKCSVRLKRLSVEEITQATKKRKLNSELSNGEVDSVPTTTNTTNNADAAAKKRTTRNSMETDDLISIS